MAAFTVLAGSTALLGAASLWPSLWLVSVSAVLVGFALAGHAPTQEVIWANYFGRFSLGAIRSIGSPFSIVFSAGGPIFAGWVSDRFGSYQAALAAFALASLVGAVLVYYAGPPRKALKENVAAASLTFP